MHWITAETSSLGHWIFFRAHLNSEMVVFSIDNADTETKKAPPQGQGYVPTKVSTFGVYSIIDATTPAPTVRPPSRIAKRRPSSMAIGAISSTSMAMLSPGITISTPSGSFTDPVTAEEAKAFPFQVVEGSAHGEPQIVVDWRGERKELRPEEVSAMVLAGKFYII